MELRTLKKKDGTEVLQQAVYAVAYDEKDGVVTYTAINPKWQDVPTVVEE